MQSSWWTGAYPITQPYGYTDFEHPHEGIDFGMNSGTEIVAAVDGCYVIGVGIEAHNYGDFYPTLRVPGLAYDLIFGHCDKTVVERNVLLKKGQVFALSGGGKPNEGVTTGPHMHFEARLAGYPYGHTVDPTPYLTIQQGDDMPLSPDFRTGLVRMLECLARPSHDMQTAEQQALAAEIGPNGEGFDALVMKLFVAPDSATHIGKLQQLDNK